jgi:hypothetical protein
VNILVVLLAVPASSLAVFPGVLGSWAGKFMPPTEAICPTQPMSCPLCSVNQCLKAFYSSSEQQGVCKKELLC